MDQAPIASQAPSCAPFRRTMAPQGHKIPLWFSLDASPAVCHLMCKQITIIQFDGLNHGPVDHDQTGYGIVRHTGIIT